MAQRSHIPKFGSWDGDNVPYTAYFESARKDKGSGVKMMNPNDPEENPEAFMFAGGGATGNDGDNSDKVILAKKHQVEEWKPVFPKTADRQKNVSRKSMTSESSSYKTNSDYSQQSNNRHARSEQKNSSSERSNSFCPPSPGPTRPRNGYNPADNIASQRSASVPIFGAWDERDPKSGDGFTVIFEKVKEEKQIAAAKFPPVPQQPTNFSNSYNKKETRAKKCCCFF